MVLHHVMPLNYHTAVEKILFFTLYKRGPFNVLEEAKIIIPKACRSK